MVWLHPLLQPFFPPCWLESRLHHGSKSWDIFKSSRQVKFLPTFLLPAQRHVLSSLSCYCHCHEGEGSSRAAPAGLLRDRAWPRTAVVAATDGNVPLPNASSWTGRDTQGDQAGRGNLATHSLPIATIPGWSQSPCSPDGVGQQVGKGVGNGRWGEERGGNVPLSIEEKQGVGGILTYFGNLKVPVSCSCWMVRKEMQPCHCTPCRSTNVYVRVWWS